MNCTAIAKNSAIPVISTVTRTTRCTIPRYFFPHNLPFQSNLDHNFSSISIGSRLTPEKSGGTIRSGGKRLPWLPAAYGAKKGKKMMEQEEEIEPIGGPRWDRRVVDRDVRGERVVAKWKKGDDLGRMVPKMVGEGVYGGKKVKKYDGRTSKSSWEESASKYLSKNDGKLIEREDGEMRGKEEEEEEEIEPISDPRWDRIQTKYKRMVDRDERPEVVAKWKKQDNWGRMMWKEATESSVPKMVGEGVYGVGPILAALTVGRRDFYALYVQEGLALNGSNKRKKRKDKKALESILKMAEKVGLPVKKTSKHDLNMIVDNRPHQGLVLDASPLEMVTIKELDPVEGGGNAAPVWVALDEVTDPQNLGAILRSSYFFGVQGVVVCAKNSAPLSGVVSKAGAGALELIELRACKNMMQFLTLSAENGWRVLGGSVSSKAVSLNEVEGGMPTILVLGSEGTGLRPLVERSCTQLVKIQGNIQSVVREDDEDGSEGDDELDESSSGREFNLFLAVESLNVSVATGVLLYHLVGKSSSHHVS